MSDAKATRRLERLFLRVELRSRFVVPARRYNTIMAIAGYCRQGLQTVGRAAMSHSLYILR